MTNQHGQMSLFFINNSRMSSCGPIYQTFPLRTSIVSEFKVMSSLEVWYIFTLSVLCVKSLRLCPTLCDPMDYNAQGSSVHGILHARVLEWVATSSSSGSSQPRDRTHVSCVSSFGRWYHLAPPRKPQGRYTLPPFNCLHDFIFFQGNPNTLISKLNSNYMCRRPRNSGRG